MFQFARASINSEPAILALANQKQLFRVQKVCSILECLLMEEQELRGNCRAVDDASMNSLVYMSPFEFAPAFFDGSAFLSHVERARHSRGARTPDTLQIIPLMYQGCAEFFFAPTEAVKLLDDSYGLDYEAELAVIVHDTPCGVSVDQAEQYILGATLLCDWTYRNLLPAEFETGFGFIQSKPPSTLAPFIVPYKQFSHHQIGKGYDLFVECTVDGVQVGKVSAEQMHFSFAELIAHAARTRPLRSGTIIGSGTISHSDVKQGTCCITEKRAIELLQSGEATAPFLSSGQIVSLQVNKSGEDIFGSIKANIE